MTFTFDPLLTTQQAADVLGVCRRTLQIWANEGRLPVSRTVGGHRRLRHSDVLALQVRLAFPLGTSEADMLTTVTHQRDVLKKALEKISTHPFSPGDEVYLATLAKTALTQI